MMTRYSVFLKEIFLLSPRVVESHFTVSWSFLINFPGKSFHCPFKILLGHGKRLHLILYLLNRLHISRLQLQGTFYYSPFLSGVIATFKSYYPGALSSCFLDWMGVLLDGSPEHCSTPADWTVQAL